MARRDELLERLRAAQLSHDAPETKERRIQAIKAELESDDEERR